LVITIVIFVVLVVIGLVLIGRGAVALLPSELTGVDSPGHASFGLVVAGLIVLGVAVLSTGLTIVPAGYVGVVTNFGKVEERTLPAGLQFVMPIAEAVVTVDTRVQPHEFKDIDAASKEYQQVRASGKLNYHIDPGYAYILYRQVGLDFADKVIDPALNDFIKEEMPKFTITDILPMRDKIRSDTKEAMNANLARYHIVVDDIYLANVSFSAEYEKAIEDKQVAQQQVQTQQQILAQKQIQAQQAVVDAQGKADAAVVAAQGQAKANALLTQSLTPALIQWTAIQKLNDKIQVMLLPATGNFILDTKSLLGGVTP
jgi:regulator of protease activity HflC (stomatin/prohibitin superfamily)